MNDPNHLNQLAADLAEGRVRLLRKLELSPAGCPDCNNADTSIGLVADVECTGLDPSRDRIIELSMRRFRYAADGTITKLDKPYSWLEDPGTPLTPFISRLTGLTDEDVRGKNIEVGVATALLRSATIRICHNCAYDRSFIEERLQGATGLAWACSMSEIDWHRRGMDGGGRSLQWLLAQCGFFVEGAHRAAVDVDAVLAVLQHTSTDGQTALAELLHNAGQTGWRFAAYGAAFGEVTRALKARGYRWDADARVWSREVAEEHREEEKAWLEENVYNKAAQPKYHGLIVEQVDCFTRYL